MSWGPPPSPTCPWRLPLQQGPLASRDQTEPGQDRGASSPPGALSQAARPPPPRPSFLPEVQKVRPRRERRRGRRERTEHAAPSTSGPRGHELPEAPGAGNRLNQRGTWRFKVWTEILKTESDRNIHFLPKMPLSDGEKGLNTTQQKAVAGKH